MRRRIFLHFVDHEILKRISTGSQPVYAICDRLIRMATVISPDPPLFPISAHHEERAISGLLRNLIPLIRADFLSITGFGANPHINLESRRGQFAQDTHIFTELFAPTQDALVDEFSGTWVEKQGSTTYGIRTWWNAGVIRPDSNLSIALYEGRPLSDRVIDSLVELPDALDGRPLLAEVVMGALDGRRLLPAGSTPQLRGSLGVQLTRQWAGIYCDDLRATVFSDLGRGIPDTTVFTPAHFSTVSARKVELLLSELDMISAVENLPVQDLATVLDTFRIEREYLADDIFTQASSETERWSHRRLDILARYRKRRQRSTLSFGAFLIARRRYRSANIRKAATNLARSLDCYAEARREYSQHQITGRHVMSDKSSFRISHITGDINIAQDSATINSVKISSTSLADRLLQAATSEETARQFIDWLTANKDRFEGQASADSIVGEVDKKALTSERKMLLRRVASGLAIAASSSTVITAVVKAIEALVK